MHELAVTQSVLEIALRHAAPAGAVRITDVYLVIGQLSSIVDDSVQFYWDAISENTAAQGARLHFRRVPAELRCWDCNHRYSPNGEDLACPACGGLRVQVVAGDEFRVEAIEVEPVAAPAGEPP
ncbi:MAG: hydrogenase maturation nickel metallochaperone HypA [Anaerolineales bacterium]|nr:hydrogenase maturation nickel metallochaperone HypA [Anaerolineales bacterium]